MYKVKERAVENQLPTRIAYHVHARLYIYSR